jgi:carboxylesterase type B
VDPVFSTHEIVVQKDIKYGSAYNNETKSTQILTLDAYFPPASDKRTARPAAVLVHGGSFETGDSRSDDEPVLAQNLVERGYVAVYVHTRLTVYK